MARMISLRIKLIVLTCSLLIGFGLAVSVYLKVRFADQLTGELLKRGISIAHHLSTLSANAFIAGDTLYLDYLAKDHHEAEDDIVYIFMLNSSGGVLAHSFADSYPTELTAVNPLAPGQSSSVMLVDVGMAGKVYDIAVPVLDGRIGSVHLGISAATVINSVNALVLRIILAIGLLALVGLAIAWSASRQITAPVGRLTVAVDALAEGDRELQLPVTTRDEVGQLTVAFNRLVAQIGAAEDRLSHQKRFLETLLDDIPTPVYFTDLQGRVLGCNRAYCTFFGHARSEVLGRDIKDFRAQGEIEMHSAGDSEFPGALQPLRTELQLRDTWGKLHQMIVHKAPFMDEANRPAGVVVVMLDITRERQSEEFRREFVSTVAHEFQTPLATIIGFADLLQENNPDAALTAEALKTITAKATTLSEMVDELLDLSRIEGGRTVTIEPVLSNLRPLLAETLDHFNRNNANHKLDWTLPETPLELHADPKRLMQVVDNLLSNAAKYSDPGTSIEFHAGMDETTFRFTIADQGIGMTAEQRAHLFEKFYRANTSNVAPPGTGLGLYICKAIVDAHHGEITIDSSPGQGTRVTVSLPLKAVSTSP